MKYYTVVFLLYYISHARSKILFISSKLISYWNVFVQTESKLSSKLYVISSKILFDIAIKITPKYLNLQRSYLTELEVRLLSD